MIPDLALEPFETEDADSDDEEDYGELQDGEEEVVLAKLRIVVRGETVLWLLC